MFENQIGEIQLKIGNSVSVAALATAAFWDIDVLITTQRGRPVVMLKGLDDDSHIKTRICPYEALKNGKGMQIAKNIVIRRIESQNQLLKKHGLRQLDLMRAKEMVVGIESDKLNVVRQKLVAIEGNHTEQYFHQVFQLMPKTILKTDRRRNFRAYDGINSTMNLGYEVLRWKVFRAIVRAKPQPRKKKEREDARKKKKLARNERQQSRQA